MTYATKAAPSRRGFLLGGLAAGVAVTGVLAAPSIARAAWYVRRLRMKHAHTGETLNVEYFADGEYFEDSLSEIDYFLRDWRQDEVKRQDRDLLDMVAEVHQMLDTDKPFRLICGYRSPKTNEMLRRRSNGVARRSLHLEARAIDIGMEGRSAREIQRAGLSLGRGGVGLYSRSGFVHLDTGAVRQWGG